MLVTLLTTGAAGAVVSTVIASGGEATLTLPTASVAVTVMVWLPSASGAPGVKVQLPKASATVVPSTPPTEEVTVIVAPGSAPPPFSVGVLSLVTSSVFEAPVSEPTSRSGAPGWAGAVVSITRASLSARFWPTGITVEAMALPATSWTPLITKLATVRSALLSPAPTVYVPVRVVPVAAAVSTTVSPVSSVTVICAPACTASLIVAVTSMTAPTP